MANKSPSNILGVDVGGKRIGLAIASEIAKLPRPFSTIANNDQTVPKIQDIISKNNISQIALGVPKNLEGEETAQSAVIRQFGEKLKSKINVPLTYTDETLSSVRAREYIRQNKLKTGDIDSISACFILEEFYNRQGEV